MGGSGAQPVLIKEAGLPGHVGPHIGNDASGNDVIALLLGGAVGVGEPGCCVAAWLAEGVSTGIGANASSIVADCDGRQNFQEHSATVIKPTASSEAV